MTKLRFKHNYFKVRLSNTICNKICSLSQVRIVSCRQLRYVNIFNMETIGNTFWSTNTMTIREQACIVSIIIGCMLLTWLYAHFKPSLVNLSAKPLHTSVEKEVIESINSYEKREKLLRKSRSLVAKIYLGNQHRLCSIISIIWSNLNRGLDIFLADRTIPTL